MIFGVGIDVVEIERVEEMIERWGDRFLGKVFLPQEIAYCRRYKRYGQHFAVRVAAKEAASKALGTGWSRGVHWKLVEVARSPGERPRILLHGIAAELAAAAGVNNIALTMTHGEELAVAEVIMEIVAGDRLSRKEGDS